MKNMVFCNKTLMLVILVLATTIFANAQQKDPLAKYYKSETTSKQPSKSMTDYPEFDDFINQKLDFSVPIISVQEFKELKEEKELILLDTRSEFAYNTSHITNAKRVGYDDFSIERVWTLPRDANIVVYCTVGAQSEKVGKYLTDMGFSNVQNLYGSIIEWVNQGGVVINKKNNKTKKVVVKDEERKHFLKKGRAIIYTQTEMEAERANLN